MDYYESRAARPMLIGASGEAFDDPEYLFELKLDGERCIAYLDPAGETELRNKREWRMLPKMPELAALHRRVGARCILDGELIVMKEGRPDFAEVQRRSLMSNRFKIDLAARQYPATFTAFDILYLEGETVTKRPLTQRKALLEQVVTGEDGRFALSRVIREKGSAFYALAEAQGLEGIVAKKRDSLYYPGRRTGDWIKIKNLLDDDFVVCGYIDKENNVSSLILGQYRGDELIYKGHVTLGVNGSPFARIRALPAAKACFSPIPRGNREAHWVPPVLVCTVQYLQKTEAGGLRHPIFKGLRDDKTPEECRET